MFSATWPEEVQVTTSSGFLVFKMILTNLTSQELASEFLGDFTFMNVGSVELSANKDITQVLLQFLILRQCSQVGRISDPLVLIIPFFFYNLMSLLMGQ